MSEYYIDRSGRARKRTEFSRNRKIVSGEFDGGMGISLNPLDWGSSLVDTVSDAASSALNKFGDVTGINRAIDTFKEDVVEAKAAEALAKSETLANKALTDATYKQLEAVRQKIADTKAAQTVSAYVPGAAKIIGEPSRTSSIPPQGQPALEEATKQLSESELESELAKQAALRAEYYNAQSAEEKQKALIELAKAIMELAQINTALARAELDKLPEADRNQVLKILEYNGFAVQLLQKKKGFPFGAILGVGVVGAIAFIYIKRKKGK